MKDVIKQARWAQSRPEGPQPRSRGLELDQVEEALIKLEGLWLSDGVVVEFVVSWCLWLSDGLVVAGTD